MNAPWVLRIYSRLLLSILNAIPASRTVVIATPYPFINKQPS